MINVAEIFGPTIQGEGPHVGIKTLFVRVVGCNFTCKWCFGIMPNKFRLPRVIRSYDNVKSEAAVLQNRSGVPMTEIKVGDKLLTYDDNMNLVETEVQEVLKHKAKCITLKIRNKTYLVTPNHPFFTTKGIVEAGDLTPEDEIILLTQSDFLRLKNSFGGVFNKEIIDRVNKLKQQDSSVLASAEFHKRLYEAYVNNSVNIGENNGQFGGGSERHFMFLKHLVNNGDIAFDELTGQPSKNLVVHHIDNDHSNDSFDNLIILDRRVHDIIHERGYNFHDHESKVIEVCHITEIGEWDGEVDVLNFHCEPYNSYFADGMWVHNCDSKFAWKVDSNTMKFEPGELANKLVQMCKDTHTSNVVLTGGNPCLYDFGPIIAVLHHNKITVDVETQGAPLPYWVNNVDLLVISPKAPSSGQLDVYENVKTYLKENPLQRIAVKIPVFDEEDFQFAVKYAELLQHYPAAELYLSVGNTDVTEQGDISRRVLDDYLKLIERVMASELDRVFILPQVHTLVWNNKQGV